MYYVDQRLARVLRDIRLERAESQRRRQSSKHRNIRHKLGLLLIAKGERLARQQAKAA